MKVILRQNVENLGDMGQVVSVKDGYARNFLIPRNMAYFANETALRRLEGEKRQYAKRQQEEKAKAEIIAAKLADIQVTIPMKVGDEGKLFGSVTPQAIGKELDVLGYSVDRRNIVIDEPIKTLGIFSVKVKLHHDVVAPLKVWVISEE
jgi:large subunit ribosomal protein L9